MQQVILIIHLILTLALIGLVLLQKSEGGALGIGGGGGGGGGMAGFLTGRATANILTRATALVALFFFITSMSLAWMSANSRAPRSIVDTPKTERPASKTPAKPPAPVKPSVPTK